MVIKLNLEGYLESRDMPMSAYYSWPRGIDNKTVDKLIENFKKKYSKVSIVIQHYDEEIYE